MKKSFSLSLENFSPAMDQMLHDTQRKIEEFILVWKFIFENAINAVKNFKQAILAMSSILKVCN